MGMLLLLIAAAAATAAAAADCTFEQHYPRHYVARRAHKQVQIDGILGAEWDHPQWTENFVDIATSIKPQFQTAAKLMWDDNFLYIGAILYESQIWANISQTCHCVNSSQDQIIYHDNDFEIFVDADGSAHYYKEFEVNAHGATWDLCLNKPYRNGGYENSSRVFGDRGYDMPGYRVGISIEGGFNTPLEPSQYWTVEVALPLASLVQNTTAALPPKKGTYWRINFSRVEWNVVVRDGKFEKQPSCKSCSPVGDKTEDNWVWQPMGEVNMHNPERWGFLQFGEDDDDKVIPSEEWPIRFAAATIYDAEVAFSIANQGNFTSRIADLKPYARNPAAIDGSCTKNPLITLFDDNTKFEAVISNSNFTAFVNSDRLIRVERDLGE